MEPRALPASDTDIAELLVATSRTFALAIPLLEEPLATQVGVAYLLFRIADTLEDAPRWGRDRRARALRSFASWIPPESSGAAHEEWRALAAELAPTDDAGCVELLARAGGVLARAAAMPGPVGAAMLDATRRTALGMAEFVDRQDERGGLELADVDDLRRYAYVVAGIVGELLTVLFTFASPELARSEPATALEANAAAFGEGLQLVNILKDAPADRLEGRVYLPRGVPRSSIIELAREDLVRASAYVRTLREAGAAPGIVTFCELPARLADATLDALDAGRAKLAREDVMRIYREVTSRPGA